MQNAKCKYAKKRECKCKSAVRLTRSPGDLVIKDGCGLFESDRGLGRERNEGQSGLVERTDRL